MEQQTPQRRGMKANVWTGLLFLFVGGILLLRQSGYPLPAWLFSWPMILIVIGVFIGIKNRFRDFTWLILLIIGSVFLAGDILPGFQIRHYAAPVIVISLGLLFIFAPKRMCRNGIHRKQDQFRRRCRRHGERNEVMAAQDDEPTEETSLDIVSIFAGVKKKVLSKQFTGGDIVCIFGGSEINLTNADFSSPVVLDLVQIFGGTKLLVPANWEIRSEIAAVFGGIDDKRPQLANITPERTVILKGTIIFGGVEVNSF